MPVMTPAPGLPPVAPLIPVAGAPSPAARPGAAAGIAAAGDPVDSVSLSPAALLQQVSDAPGVTARRLGALLREFEQIAQLTSRAAPLALGELAAEIGAAAGDLGAEMRALLPGSAPAPLRLAGAAAMRALEMLASASRQARGEDMEPTRRDEPPAGSADGIGPDAAAPLADPVREAQAAAGAALRDAADALSRMRLRLDAAPASVAADDGAAHAPGPGHGAAWCGAQIALAQAQVAHASRAIARPWPAASRRRRSAARPHRPVVEPAGAAGRCGPLVRMAALLALSCIAATVLWATSRLDLTLARAAAAMLLTLAGLAWGWRRGRIRIELRR